MNSITYTDLTHATLNISTVGATPGTRTITVTNPDGQTASAAVFTVSKTSTTIGTVLSSGTITVGTSVHDTATLSGETGNAGGSVTYNVYSNSNCTSSAVFTDTETVTSGVVPNSAVFVPANIGTYYWQAVDSGDSNNSGASSSCSSEPLTVTTLPGAPTNLSAVAGEGEATVSFTAPGSNGGAAISSYTVTASPGGQTGSGSGSPVIVSGLTNGVAYTFTVTATNSVGTGPSSAASNPVTPTADTRSLPPPPPAAGPMPTVPVLTVPGGVRPPPPGQ